MDSRDLDPQPIEPEPEPEPDLEPRPPVITPDPLQARLIPGEIAVLAVVAVIVLVGAWVGLEFAGMVTEPPDPSASPIATRGAQASPSPSGSPTLAPSSSPVASPSATATPSESPAASMPGLPVTAGPDLSGRWRRIREAPIGGRTDAAVAWTGTEFLVWGGFNGEARWGDGAAYDPAANTWRRLPKSPLSARMAPASAWSGREFLIWGGFRGSHADDGAAYNPTTGRWRALPTSPLAAGPAGGAWTNGGFLVVTGVPSAALYDPESDGWTELEPPPLDVGQLEVVVVTGRVFVVRRSATADEPTQIALLVRADRSWRRLDDGPPSAADARTISAAPYLLVGDLAFDTDARSWSPLDLGDCPYQASAAASIGDALVVSPAAALDLAALTCRVLPAAPSRPDVGERIEPPSVWTGRDWIAWSGAPSEGSSGPYDNDGVAFAPEP